MNTTVEHIEASATLPQSDVDDGRFRVAARLRVAWEQRRVIFRITIGGLLLSTLVAFLIPKRYTAKAQLMPPDTLSGSSLAMLTTRATNAGGALGPVSTDLLGLKSAGALFVGMLRSETCQMRLVEKFELQKAYHKKLREDARIELDERTTIAEDRKSGIISISVSDRSPQKAAAMANGYVDQLNLLVTELSTSSAHRERVFLEDRLKVAKQDLDETTSQLAQFSSKSGTLDIEQTGKAMLDAAGKLAGELVLAQSELQGLRQIYTEDNVRVQSLSARVAELRRQVTELDGGKRNRAGVLAAAEKMRSGSADIPYPSIRRLPLLGVRYAEYYREAKIQETVYEFLTEHYELAKIQEAKETPSVKTLDPARVPEKKSFPPRLLIVLLGTLLAGCASLLGVVGAAMWGGTGPEDPRKALAKEVEATVIGRVRWISQKLSIGRLAA